MYKHLILWATWSWLAVSSTVQLSVPSQCSEMTENANLFDVSWKNLAQQELMGLRVWCWVECLSDWVRWKRSGVGVTKLIGNFLNYFPNFLSLSKHTLAIEYHIYIWQVSPQLSCGHTYQIWMWFKESTSVTGTFTRLQILLWRNWWTEL